MELRYNGAYHLHCQLPLRSGRTITLEALDQQMTYAGLGAGPPSVESNDSRIEHALREAGRYCIAGTKPHLLPPPRRNYLREPGDSRLVVERSPNPRRVPEWLPMVRCIGSFKDVVKARDPDKDLSLLTVVWFQDEYALPVLEPALSQLLAIDWELLAVDIDL